MAKRLYKSQNRMLFGVCGGIADFFNIDPVLVRLAFVILTCLKGSGVLIYIVGAIIIPQRPFTDSGDSDRFYRNAGSSDHRGEERRSDDGVNRSARTDDEFNSYFNKK